MSRNSARLLSALLLLAGACAKPPTVLRNGVEVPVEVAAQRDYAEAERFFAKKQYKAAAAKFQAVATELKDSSYADNALFRIAQISRNRKDPRSAQTALEALLTRYPKSDVFEDAKEELALLLMGEKEYRRAAELFSSLPWTDLTPGRRARLEKPARQAFDLSHSFFWKLKWLVTLGDLDPESVATFERQKEIIALLEETLDAGELERYAEGRDNKFPADYIYFKLAKYYAHAGNPEAARKFIAAFLNRFPKHALAREAVELSDRLSGYRNVDSKAVGLLVPLTGSGDNLSQQVLQGAALAMNVFLPPDPGADPVRLFIEDSGDTPEQAVAALEKLVREHSVIAVAGPMVARQSQAAALSATEMGLPIVSMSAAEGVTQIGATVFRNSLTKSEQATNLAYLARDILGIRRCAILYPANNYGVEFMKFFWDDFAARGGEIRAVESYDAESKDIATAVKKMVGLSPLTLREREICSKADSKIWKEKKCYPADKLPPIVDFEAIFIPDNFDMAAQVAPTLAYYDVRGVQLLGTNLWNTAELLAGGNAEFLQGAIFLDGFFRDKKTPPVPQFVEKFYSVVGKEPGVFEAFAYDTIGLLLNVIQKEAPSSRESFAAALSRVKDYPGVTGAISIKQNRDAIRRLTILTVDGTRITEIE